MPQFAVQMREFAMLMVVVMLVMQAVVLQKLGAVARMQADAVLTLVDASRMQAVVNTVLVAVS